MSINLKVIVNGNEKEFSKGITLQALLEELALTGKVMAAAVNMDIVKQDSWAQHVLKEGDKLELLDFVGGG